MYVNKLIDYQMLPTYEMHHNSNQEDPAETKTDSAEVKTVEMKTDPAGEPKKKKYGSIMKLKDYFLVAGLLVLGLLLGTAWFLVWPTDLPVKCDSLRDINHPKSDFPPHLVQGIFAGAASLIFIVIVILIEMFRNEKAFQIRGTIVSFGVNFAGAIVTLLAAHVLGNVIGELSPNFLASCLPEIPFDQLCLQKVLSTGLNAVDVVCTTDESIWVPARSSSFPRMISYNIYLMTVFSVWITKRHFNSVINGIIIALAYGSMGGLSLLGYRMGEASVLDIMSAWSLGGGVAGFFELYVMNWFNPNWFEKKKDERPKLPFYITEIYQGKM